MDLVKLIDQFGSEDKCREYLEELRWPEGVECPRCEGRTISRLSRRRQFECDGCRYQFSVTAGTVFHDSHLPLWKWFLAIYIVSESKKGVSSKQLQRMLGVSYKTAWYLSHRIRDAMGDDEQPLLRGIVEIDETLVGGKRPGYGAGYRGNKSTVVGAIERGGEIRLRVVPNRSRENLHGFIRAVVADEAEALHTDEFVSYRGIGDEDTRHETVEHRAEEYVRGDVHTNGIESAWSLLKRSIIGSYHHVSVKHLPSYLDEMEFRFNRRDNPYLFRDVLMVLLGGDALPYAKLIERKPIGADPRANDAHIRETARLMERQRRYAERKS
jgi:transposase-like protein